MRGGGGAAMRPAAECSAIKSSSIKTKQASARAAAGGWEAGKQRARRARERLGMSSVLDTLLHANSMPLLFSTTTLQGNRCNTACHRFQLGARGSHRSMP